MRGMGMSGLARSSSRNFFHLEAQRKHSRLQYIGGRRGQNAFLVIFITVLSRSGSRWTVFVERHWPQCLSAARKCYNSRADPSAMDFWRENVDRILTGNEMPLLDHKGTVSHQEMEEYARAEYGKFDARRKKHDAELADEQDLEELRQLEQAIKKQE